MEETAQNGLSMGLPCLDIPSVLDNGLPFSLHDEEDANGQCQDYYEYDDEVTPQNGMVTPNEQIFSSKYNKLEKIGEGSNGTVYKCLHLAKSKIYAVKIMHLDDQWRKNLKKNFRIVRCLKHENVTTYKSLYLHRSQNTCYLVMQYFPHPSLDRKSKFSQEELMCIARQILTVLKYFHRMNFWHRDIKPQNILYDRQSKNVKVIDFGVGKRNQVDQGFKEVMHTITGTSSYRAPEIFTYRYDQKIDCWALGITLYELVAHCKPYQTFEPKTVGQYIDHLKKQSLRFPQPEWNQYSEHLQDLIKRLLKLKAQDRISAADALKHPWFYSAELKPQEQGYTLKVNKAQGKKWTYSDRGNSTNQRFFKSDYINSKKEGAEEKTERMAGMAMFADTLISSDEQYEEQINY